MDFSLTDVQQSLVTTAGRWLAARWPADRLAELADTGGTIGAVDDWAAFERQGWLDHELGPVELGLLAIECGYALQPVPWLVTVAARPTHPTPGRPSTVADGEVQARSNGALDGTVTALDAVASVVVTVHAAGGPRLAEVDLTGPGASTNRPQTLDPWRGRVSIRLDGAPARLLPTADPAGALAEAAALRDALLSGEAVGVAARALDIAVTYAKQREQFGRPIGAYQAVSHLLADAFADLELARSSAYRAFCVLAEPTPAAVRAEALATAAEAGARAAVGGCESAIQVLGGTGVTWEHPLHRWYRRALWHRAERSGAADPLLALADLVIGPA